MRVVGGRDARGTSADGGDVLSSVRERFEDCSGVEQDRFAVGGCGREREADGDDFWN